MQRTWAGGARGGGWPEGWGAPAEGKAGGRDARNSRAEVAEPGGVSAALRRVGAGAELR